MAKTEKYWWFIGQGGSDEDDVFMELKYLTVKQAKQYIVNKVKATKAEDKESWDFGTDTIDKVQETYNGTHLYAFACFYDRHSDYVAERVPDNFEIKEEKR